MILIFLIIVAILAHAMIVPVGLYLHNSDYAIHSLWVEGLGRERLTPFFYQQPWGGTIFSIFRIPFWHFFSKLSGDPLLSHWIFNYSILPVLMALSAYWLVKQWCSARSAFLVGFFAAIGLQFWVHLYGNDFYFGAYFIGVLLLGWRAHLKNPFRELSLQKLFIAGLLSGWILYAYRPGIAYVLAFWLDLPTAIQFIREKLFNAQRFSKRGRLSLDRYFQILFWMFVGFYFYLKIFGEEVGKFQNQIVKLHAFSNLKLALLPLLALLLLHVKTLYKKGDGKKSVIVFGGIFLGLLPEAVFWLTNKMPVGSSSTSLAWFAEGLRVFMYRFPGAIREMITGYVHLSYDFGLLQNCGIFLIVGALVAVGVRAKKNLHRFHPIFQVALWSILLYVLVKTYDHGPTRYLFTLTPALLLGLGFFFEDAKKSVLARVFSILLLVGFSIYTLRERFVSVRAYENTGMQEEISSIVRVFKKEGVETVITDDYWWSNNLELVSHAKPYFVSIERRFGPEAGYDLARSEKKVGILLLHKDSVITAEKDEAIVLMNRRWKLKPLVEGYPRAHLYLGSTHE